MRPLLGSLLLERGLLTQKTLGEALHEQEMHGTRLGDVLVSHGHISPLQLRDTLAQHFSLPVYEADGAMPIFTPPHLPHLDEYLRHRFIPYAREKECLLIACADPTKALREWLAAHYGTCTLALATPYDIRQLLEQHFGSALEERSRLALWQRDPELSARESITRRQGNIFGTLLLLSCLGFMHAPLPFLFCFILLCHFFFIASMGLKFFFTLLGMRRSPPQAPFSLSEAELPVISILLPVYREEKCLESLLEHMQKLDYPVSKLDIKLLIEADDDACWHQALALRPARNVELLRVPPSILRTKPRACNYALPFAKGALLVIFDADDRPEPDQLRKAANQFAQSPARVACLQAKLGYYNAKENALTRAFALEYGMLFHVSLKGLERARMPIPLGGTSNYFKLDVLRELGEWDAYNVTEDADLGIRLAAHGYITHMLDSTTYEEAPIRLKAWIRQRSRWIKGYMQTWLVHMRRPGHLFRQAKIRGMLGFQVFIGLSVLCFLVAPFMWLLSLLFLFRPNMPDSGTLAFIKNVNFISLALYFILTWFCTLERTFRQFPRDASFVLAALAYPFYLLLHSVASWRALRQLLINPHFWDKTEHAVTKLKR